ncbi:MAG: type II toxin-antitoxin system MqsA family antitoxin [Gemmatimonadota bacterium]
MIQHCPLCDSKGELVHERRALKLGRRTAVVDQEFYRCGSCGEEWFTPEQMDAAQRRAAAQVRQEEDLLEPDAIKAIRDDLQLSQAQFEKLLGFGPKTVGRWERGTVFQNRSSDLLMRLVRDFPDVVRYLAGRHGVELAVGQA